MAAQGPGAGAIRGGFDGGQEVASGRLDAARLPSAVSPAGPTGPRSRPAAVRRGASPRQPESFPGRGRCRSPSACVGLRLRTAVGGAGVAETAQFVRKPARPPSGAHALPACWRLRRPCRSVWSNSRRRGRPADCQRLPVLARYGQRRASPATEEPSANTPSGIAQSVRRQGQPTFAANALRIGPSAALGVGLNVQGRHSARAADTDGTGGAVCNRDGPIQRGRTLRTAGPLPERWRALGPPRGQAIPGPAERSAAALANAPETGRPLPALPSETSDIGATRWFRRNA